MYLWMCKGGPEIGRGYRVRLLKMYDKESE